MEVVDDPGTDDSIWWLPHGESFVIRPKTFNQTLDSYFQGSKIFSFTRKLYRYGFRKIVTSQDCAMEDLVFSHPCFQKGKPQLLQYVTGSNKHMYSSQAIEAQNKAGSKVAPQPEKRPVVMNPPPLPTRQQFVQVTPPFVSSMATRPSRRFPPVLSASTNHPPVMMLRETHPAVLLAQQRLQQARMLIPGGLRRSLVPQQQQQSQLLDLLIQRRLAELQSLQFP